MHSLRKRTRQYNSAMPQGDYLQFGGQAIIEGVMMRSPRYFAVAVRAPNKEIVLQREPIEKTWIGRQKWLKLPFLRGTWALLDAMTLGFKALNFSSKIQLDPAYQADGPAFPNGTLEPDVPKRDSKAIQSITVGVALVLGLGLGLFLFNYLPNFLAVQLTTVGVQHPTLINLATEIVKLTFFLAYIGLIGLIPDIKRLFEYHGGEHKAINTLEADQELTLENCKKQTRLHPRCGTSFAMIVLLLGFVVFTFMPKPQIVGSLVLTSIARFLVEIPVLPLIAGVAYEVIRFAGRMRNKRWVMILLAPGLMTQYLTTREPKDDQIEVALTALRAVVDAEEEEKVQAKKAEEAAAPVQTL